MNKKVFILSIFIILIFQNLIMVRANVVPTISLNTTDANYYSNAVIWPTIDKDIAFTYRWLQCDDKDAQNENWSEIVFDNPNVKTKETQNSLTTADVRKAYLPLSQQQTNKYVKLEITTDGNKFYSQPTEVIKYSPNVVNNPTMSNGAIGWNLGTNVRYEGSVDAGARTDANYPALGGNNDGALVITDSGTGQMPLQELPLKLNGDKWCELRFSAKIYNESATTDEKTVKMNLVSTPFTGVQNLNINKNTFANNSLTSGSQFKPTATATFKLTFNPAVKNDGYQYALDNIELMPRQPWVSEVSVSGTPKAGEYLVPSYTHHINPRYLAPYGNESNSPYRWLKADNTYGPWSEIKNGVVTATSSGNAKLLLTDDLIGKYIKFEVSAKNSYTDQQNQGVLLGFPQTNINVIMVKPKVECVINNASIDTNAKRITINATNNYPALSLDIYFVITTEDTENDICYQKDIKVKPVLLAPATSEFNLEYSDLTEGNIVKIIAFMSPSLSYEDLKENLIYSKGFGDVSNQIQETTEILKCEKIENKSAIKVYGQTNSARNQSLLYVLKPNKTIENIFSDMKNALSYITITNEMDKKFTRNVNISDLQSGENYTLVLQNETDNKTLQFKIFSDATYTDLKNKLRTLAIGDILKLLNDEILISTTKLSEMINLGVDYSKLTRKEEVAKSISNTQWSDDGDIVIQLQNKFNEYVAFQKEFEECLQMMKVLNLEELDNSIETLKAKNSFLKFDLTNEFGFGLEFPIVADTNNYKKNILSQVISLIGSNDVNMYNYAECKNMFGQIVFINAMNSKLWSKYAQILEQSKSFHNIDLTIYKYAKLTDYNKNKLFQNMCVQSGLVSIASIKAFIETESQALYDTQTETSIPTGRGDGSNNKNVNSDLNGTTITTNVPLNNNINTTNSQILSDAKDVSWAADSIEYLVSKKIISGYPDGTYKPNNLVTRTEFIAMLVKGLKLINITDEADFSDVQKGDWGYQYIASGQKNGIVKGYSGEKFNGDNNITREELAAFMARAIERLDIMVEQEKPEIEFADHSEISEYARENVMFLYSIGVVNGTSSDIKMFEPKIAVTRAMAAKCLHNLLIRIN